jgi:hypothetical protein
MSDTFRSIGFVLGCGIFLAACSEQATDVDTVAAAPQPEAGEPSSESEPGYGEQLGSIEFPVSCNEAARPLMERGLALLHHMTYSGAEATFGQAIKADPDCALAYWGVPGSGVHCHDPCLL